jgi:hypothetical protein
MPNVVEHARKRRNSRERVHVIIYRTRDVTC